MTIYANSTHARQTAGQGRHRRAGMTPLMRWLTTMAAFLLALVALSGGLVLLADAGLDTVTSAPALALIFIAGIAFAIMILVVNTRGDG